MSDKPIVTVRFSDEGEFLEELKERGPNIDNMIRLTKSFEHSDTLPLQNVSVVATYLRDTPPVIQRIKLLRYCGQRYSVGGEDSVSRKVMKSADEIMTGITNKAHSWRFEVNAGVYE